jgi:hypothetical protein
LVERSNHAFATSSSAEVVLRSNSDPGSQAMDVEKVLATRLIAAFVLVAAREQMVTERTRAINLGVDTRIGDEYPRATLGQAGRHHVQG